MITTSNATIPVNFTLKSKELGGQLNIEQYMNGMGFSGENRSPQLYWQFPPAAAQSFAVTMYDMDAPTGSGFWHWVVYNMPTTMLELPAGAGNPANHLLPDGAIHGNSDLGTPGYAGAAPPAGPAHRYILTVHALSAKLDLENNATAALVGFNIHCLTLAKASLLLYGQAGLS